VLLRVLALSLSATRILEIGTAVGYSGIWLAGVLPPGACCSRWRWILSARVRPRDNFARAGLTDRVNVIVGDAQRMVAKVAGPFDLIFQDGAKSLYTPLLDRLVALLRRADCSSRIMSCGTARSSPASQRTRRTATIRAQLRNTTSASPPIRNSRRRSCRCATAYRFL